MTQLNHTPFIWQRPEWPYFYWDSSALLDSLVKVRHQQGRLLALATSLTSKDVALSAIQKDIYKKSFVPLTKERLCGWQASLFPNGYLGINKIICGDFRKKDFVLNSSDLQAPAKNLSEEVKRLMEWWNDSPVGLDGIIRAGIAYFWFMSLRPFDAGNEMVGQSLVFLALAEDEKTGLRSYDLENFFLTKESELQALILNAQNLNGDITLWLQWLFQQLLSAINESHNQMNKVSARDLFWKRTENSKLNLRQKKILSYLLAQANPDAVITNRGCVQMCQTSRESIKRDLKQLVDLSFLIQKNKNGRSVEYRLN